MLDDKISLVPTHQLIVSSTLLAPATEIWTHKATEIHTLKPLTYELFFQNSLKMKLGGTGESGQRKRGWIKGKSEVEKEKEMTDFEILFY